MLFWITLILTVAFTGLLAWSSYEDWEVTFGVSLFFTIVGWIASFIMIICLIVSYSAIDAQVAEFEVHYESMVYQLENDIYDNDNDFGKRDLMVEIQKWNSDLAYRKEAQKDLWLGIFYPNIYDRFEFIKLH